MNWMEKRKFQIVLFLFSVSLLALSYVLNINFRSIVDRSASESIFWVSMIVLFFTTISFFINVNKLKNWIKFTYIIYIFFIICAFLPSNYNSNFFWNKSEFLILIFAIIYSLISLGILIYSFFKKN